VNSPAFKSLNIAVLTISDTRSLDDDVSGQTLINGLTAAGHAVYDRQIVIDNIYKIRAVVSQWIANSEVDVILTTGGTGVTVLAKYLEPFPIKKLKPRLSNHGQLRVLLTPLMFFVCLVLLQLVAPLGKT
jgi:hypothetical protein